MDDGKAAQAASATSPEPSGPQDREGLNGTGRPHPRIVLPILIGLGLAVSAAVAALVHSDDVASSIIPPRPPPDISRNVVDPRSPPVIAATNKRWIAVLRSVRTDNRAELYSALRDIKAAIPKAQVTDSDTYASLNPGMSIVFVEGFSNAAATWDYCNTIDREECYGAVLSPSASDRTERVLPDQPRPT